MDTPDTSSSGRSPRRELLGPRPAPLRVRKDSHKIRKPPVVPPSSAAAVAAAPAPPPRPPVIIYTVSPKIIHANPNEFMSLVQRLTGPNQNCPNPSTSAFAAQEVNSGAVSPAARFASVERTRPAFGQSTEMVEEYGMSIQHESDHDVQRTGNFPTGILSPNPSSLPPIPPNFFLPPSILLDNNYNININNYNNNNNNNNNNNSNSSYFEHNNFMLPSPYSSSANFLISPQINMPSPNTLALFNTFFDL